MTLQDYRRAFLGRWRVIVSGLLLGALLALTLAIVLPSRYTSQVAILLSPTPVAAPGQGDALARARTSSYVPLVTQDRVTRGVADAVGEGFDARGIASAIAVSSPEDTPLLLVTVTDSSPRRAQVIGTETARRVVGLVAEVESATSGGPPPVAASVVQPATFEGRSISLPASVQVAVGALVGLLAGAGVALAREVADHSVSSAEQVRRETRWPVLATASGPPPGRDDGAAVVRAEAARTVRSALDHLAPSAGGRVLLVTGVRGGEGATALIADLAPALARAGRTVAVVEADLRRPRLAARMGADGADGGGLAAILGGGADLDGALHRDHGGGVDVLAAGDRLSTDGVDAADLLGSPRFADVVRELAGSHHTVLVGAPPVLAAADAMTVAGLAQGVVMVVALDRTTTEDLTEVTETLRIAGSPVIGAVLTRPNGARRDPDRPGATSPAAPPAPAPVEAAPDPAPDAASDAAPAPDSAEDPPPEETPAADSFTRIERVTTPRPTPRSDEEETAPEGETALEEETASEGETAPDGSTPADQPGPPTGPRPVHSPRT